MCAIATMCTRPQHPQGPQYLLQLLRDCLNLCRHTEKSLNELQCIRLSLTCSSGDCIREALLRLFKLDLIREIPDHLPQRHPAVDVCKDVTLNDQLTNLCCLNYKCFKKCKKHRGKHGNKENKKIWGWGNFQSVFDFNILTA